MTIVIPAFNEASRLPATLDRLLAELPDRDGERWQILVSDDGSEDSTLRVVDARSASARVRVITRPTNRGKGAALRAGARAATTPLVLFLDADLPVSVETLRRMVDQLGSADLLCGSRRMPGASIDPPQPMARRVGGRLFRAAVESMGFDITSDPQCGVKLLRRDRVVPLLHDMVCDGFGFDIELIERARRNGCAVREVPVSWRHVGGSSLRPVRDGVRTLAELASLRRSAHRAPAAAAST